jgi:tRNA(fMet)-specific endonuclease VapC
MKFLLHQDVFAACVRGHRLGNSRLAQDRQEVAVSAASVMGLDLWLSQSATPLAYQQVYLGMLAQLKVIPVDEETAHRAGFFGGQQRRVKPKLTRLDLVVAATALVHALTLVTHNPGHFAHLPGLAVMDWLVP